MVKKVTKLSVWERDITNEVVGVLAVFGLVVSSLVATTGVAALGVQAQIGFVQSNETSNQTAAVLLIETRRIPPPPTGMPMSAPANDEQNASSTMPMAASGAAGMYCPRIVHTIIRGSRDASSTQDVAELQRFIAVRYNLAASSTVTGYFGSTTQMYLERFQQEQGISPAPTVGPLTRAVIARLCGGSTQGNPQGGPQNSPMTSTSSPIRNPMPHMPPPPMPHATTSNSNGAAVIEAIGEIGDGYGKLLQASLGLLGL